MHYIVLDLEWNQSPRGKAGKRTGMPFEIIEIGAVKLDGEMRTVEVFNEVIKPAVYRQLHYKTKEILHMDIQELEKARKFQDVIGDFFKWCGDDYIMCTWGSMDLTELQRNLAFFKVENPMGKPLLYYDVQKLFSLLYEDGKSRRSLKDAVEYLEIEEDIPFHRAFDDTLYTVKIMQRMDLDAVRKYVSVDYFRLPDKKEEEIYIVFDRYAKYVSRVFAAREKAMADKGAVSTKCYRCGRALRKRIRWFPVNGKTYLCLAFCPEHGYMKGKLRLKKAESGGVFVVKTLKLISESDAEAIQMKRLEMLKKRKESKAGKPVSDSMSPQALRASSALRSDAQPRSSLPLK
ncbi:exonuclease domain-containing protein [Lacrimispora sp. NSJ-141]|uniref:Exonuclease domain-containing protein n=1 Tax=Lientehia hominis TaxID=2897778 RepID=A0AAP2WAG1_9FIRM|nr:3'-5' exonuclease [Lientehia hominis]MCD2493302.1 exonuclease domain-containing protein [Lientehia hominis]